MRPAVGLLREFASTGSTRVLARRGPSVKMAAVKVAPTGSSEERAMARTCLTMTMALLCGSTAFGQVKPILSVDFDRGFEGTGPNGTVAATVVGKPQLVPGKVGRAMKTGPTLGHLEFPSALLRRTAGTVEMWVCPVDWDPEDGKFHVFFEVRGQGALYLYKYWVGTKALTQN
jgi:hypothetical protein